MASHYTRGYTVKAELFSWESCHTTITTRHTVIKTELFSWESCSCAKSCKQCIELIFFIIIFSKKSGAASEKKLQKDASIKSMSEANSLMWETRVELAEVSRMEYRFLPLPL